MRMTSHVRMLCEGAMMCALTALVLLINRIFGGMIETAFPWLLVFPLLIYCVRHGIKAALTCSVSIVLLSLMLCTFTTLFYVLSAVLCALAYGSGVRQGVANRTLLWRTGLISFTSNLLSMVVLASLFGYDPLEEAQLLSELFQAGAQTIMQAALAIAIFSVIVCSLLQTLCIHFVCMRLLEVGMMSACLCAAVYGALTLMCVCLRRGHPRGMLAAYVLLFVPVINLFLVLLGEADLLLQLRGRMM